MSVAMVFPGQGSQTPGMGKDIYDAFPCAKEVFEEVDEALGQKLSDIIFFGSDEELTLTENTQPALMTVSMAALAVLRKEGKMNLADKISFVAGHSLGEYAALCAAGALSLTDTAKLLRIRGKAMQEAVPTGKGAMVALLGVEPKDAKEIAEAASDGGKRVCQVANDNAVGNIVLSGHADAIEKAIELATKFKFRKLAVSAPFHCSLMAPAADVMKDALNSVTVHVPSVPVVANVIAAPTADTAEIKELLVKQVTGTVRWRESILFLARQNVDTVLEVGAGKVLTSINKRTVPELNGINLSSAQALEEYMKTL
ncbi:MAG: ACP S-malonyltransferase [Alphaproteobacteria bacterium]|nr:ACP S-malonyltransferase [Alphaproteobacteria bacterium]